MILIEKVRKIFRARRTLFDLATRQLKSKYANSFLGIWLTIINPLLIMLAVTFVFSVIFNVPIKNFAFFALAGIFPWMFFSTAITEATFSLQSHKAIARQFTLPKEILVFASVLSHFLSFCLGWSIIYPLFLAQNIHIITLFPLLIVLLALLLLFIWGLGLMLAACNVLSRDIGQLLGVFLMFWFWITPIFYRVGMVPPQFRWICIVNPLTVFILFCRSVLFDARIPSAGIFAGLILWSLASFIGGLFIFSWLEPRVLKRL